MKPILLAALVVGVLIVVACGAGPAPAATTFESPGLPNPASKYCEDQGFRLELRNEPAGTLGYCIFPDGTECEEWAYYRGECTPGTPQP